MDLKSLLNQALKSDLLKQGADALGKQTNNIKSSSNSSSLKTLGAGAVGGGLIGMLMGSKKSKKMTKKNKQLYYQKANLLMLKLRI